MSEMGDDGTEFAFDEVLMQDMIDLWAEQYSDGITVGSWYYDCRTATVLIRLQWEREEDEQPPR